MTANYSLSKEREDIKDYGVDLAKLAEELNEKERKFVLNVRECTNQFKKNDFPMSNSDFSQIVAEYEENNEIDFGSLDFYTTVEYEVHKKFNLELVGDLAAGSGKHFFKRN